MNENEEKKDEGEEVEEKTETTEPTDDEVKKAKEEAEQAEKELAKAKSEAKNSELVKNYLRRAEKARSKANDLRGEEDQSTEETSDLSARDLIALSQKGLDENSEEAEVLKRYLKAGLIKTFSEGFEHAGVQGELSRITETQKAQAVLDENADSETILKTKGTIYSSYKRTGEIPTDPRAQKIIAEENVKGMSF